MKKKSIIKLSITAVILIALGCWINSRWNAWFGNPPEAVYSPLNEPGRILLTFGDENALSRNISWQYDSIVYPSHVELTDTFSKDTLHIDATGEVFQSRSGKAAYYVARLRSLKPSHSYSYRVCSNGNILHGITSRLIISRLRIATVSYMWVMYKILSTEKPIIF